MKIIYIIISALLLNIANAQQVVSIENTSIGSTSNTYYKDVNNILNYFVGTWIYSSNNEYLKMVLEKKTHFYDQSDNTYIDYLIGEYQYINNGVEIVNTLDRLSDINVSLLQHGLNGNLILFKNLSQLNTDGSPSIIMDMEFIDPDRLYIDSRCKIQWSNGNPLKMKFYLHDENNIIPFNGAPMNPRMPYGDYLLTKQ